MTAFVGALRTGWHPVAESDQIAGDPVAVLLLGQTYVAWRTADGELVIADDRCPHRHAPLSGGTVRDGVLECAYHGWAFGAGGRCVAIPSSGDGATIPPAAHLRVVDVVERYGLVWVGVGDDPGALPTIAEDDDPAFRRINTGVERWAVSAPRMVDNFCDVSHFPWVHAGTFGTDQDRVVAPVELGDLGEGWFGYEYEVDVAGPDGATVHRRMSTGFHLPLTVRSTIDDETGLRHVLLLCSTPVDDETSLFTFVVWRNDDHSTDPDEAVAFDRAIGAEDRRMLERIPGTLPMDQAALANVQADRCSVAWRRAFAALLD